MELSSAGHDVLLVSPAGEYGELLNSLGLRWMSLPMERRSLNLLREVKLVLWLYRLLRKERVDLIHNFTIKCVVYGSLAARLARVSARVNAVAGMGYIFTNSSLKARLLRPVVRGLMRLTLAGEHARLILQNPDDVALFERARLVNSTQIRLIPGSGVDCRRFRPTVRKRVNKNFRVLLAARLLWDKGIAEYVAAARQLRVAERKIDFLLAGNPDPGNPASVPEADIKEWVQEGLIEWLGHVDDIQALFASVNAVVLPSYREGLPKALIEAAACALPLITTDVPGCREVVTDKVSGLLVPARDAEALADAIACLQDDRKFATQLGLAAREKALREFDERIVIERTITTYQELLFAN